MSNLTQVTEQIAPDTSHALWEAPEDVPVAQTLTYLQVSFVPEGRECWALCPLHEEDTPSFHADLVTGRWYCHGCQRGGGLEDLVTAIVGDPIAALGVIRRARRLTGVAVPPEVRDLPGGFDSLAPVDPVVRWRRFQQVDWYAADVTNPAWVYLSGRGFKRDTLHGFDVRLTDWDEYPVAFPILERDRIVGYVRRRLDGGKKKYLYNAGFDAKERVAYFSLDDDSPCVVVEGVLDMMMCAQNGGRRVAALLGWRMNASKARILRAFGVDRVVCATDNTPTGEEGWGLVREYFARAERFRFPGPWVKDAGELSQHEFLGGMP